MSDVQSTPAAPAPAAAVPPVVPSPAAPKPAASPASPPSPAPAAVKPTASTVPAMSPDQLAALLKDAMTAAMTERDLAVAAYNKAVPPAQQQALLQVQWVEDVRSWWKWASVRVGMVGVFLCGLVPTTVDAWNSAPPALKDFAAHYLPSGGGSGVAAALFALQVLARVLKFRPDPVGGSQ